MYRQHGPPNPFGNGAQFNLGEPCYRSQMSRPRFQSSPRYQHHQSSPHHRQMRPDIRSPNFHPGPPGGFQSPPHMDLSYGSPYVNQGYRGNHRFGSPRGRGRGKFRDSFSSGSSPDSNPGGSNDIQMYYHPSMTSDPWHHLQQVCASKQNANASKT